MPLTAGGGAAIWRAACSGGRAGATSGGRYEQVVATRHHRCAVGADVRARVQRSGFSALGGDMTPQVFDVNGVQRDWAWLQGKYKCGMTSAPLQTTAFRLVRVDETIGPAVFI